MANTEGCELTSEPKVRCDDGLADLVAEYLACDGSHAMYDMLALMDVRPKIVEIIGVERIIQQRHKRLNQIRAANAPHERPHD